MGYEFGQAQFTGWDHLHFDPMIAAVPVLIGRRVAEDVTIPQFDPDLGGDVGEFGELGREVAAAALLGQFAKEAGSGRLFRGAAARAARLVHADGVD
jgi:hypothetical protein